MADIIPTVVPGTLDDIGALLARCRGFSRLFHVDASDGTITSNATWLPAAGEKLPESETFFFEVHLMLARPEAAGIAFADAGAKRVIAQVEAFGTEDETKRMFDVWRAHGAQEVGIAILIGTPLEALDPYLIYCDSVTLMTIPSIGVQGIPFDERGYGRVTDLHVRYPELPIEVDGGVGVQQIPALARAGASRFSVGSAIATSAHPAAIHKQLCELAEAAVS